MKSAVQLNCTGVKKCSFNGLYGDIFFQKVLRGSILCKCKKGFSKEMGRNIKITIKMLTCAKLLCS